MHVSESAKAETRTGDFAVQAPSIVLPTGGGAIRGIGEKFATNPVTGTASVTVPIATSPGRGGFGPALSLSYDSGAGNGPFGFGWTLSFPCITRKTDKGLPRYLESADEDSDVFILSGSEDLVPMRMPDGAPSGRIDGYTVRRYRPRVEGLFARIERWTLDATRDVHWRSISRDNVLTIYGRDERSRIADPDDPTRIFSWLVCETRDDRGNGVVYVYKPEDGEGVDHGRACERNRGDANDRRRGANRYLKRVLYGNRGTLLDAAGRRPRFLSDAARASTKWMFEVVFDYGEHDREVPMPDEPGKAWACRDDAFSSYRSTFEVRTNRLCRRVLMFHHFPEDPEVGSDCLVRSTDFAYSTDGAPQDTRLPTYSFLTAVTQLGYKRSGDGYLSRSLPPLQFAYSESRIEEIVRDADPQLASESSQGIYGTAYEWADLDGEGAPGLLTRQQRAWYYRRNLSPIAATSAAAAQVQFGPMECLASSPSWPAPGRVGPQLLDLAGDGQLDLVDFEGATPGFFERTREGDWAPFRAFASQPALNWRSPRLRFIDLTGDGHADLLLTEEDAFCWHASLAEAGFGPARRVVKSLDEERGPRAILADTNESLFLADLTGDGLTDFVRIRNGEVCYWPNLGYGRFGAKVTMDNAPWFEAPELFDGKRLRLADIDGSGTADIVYLATSGVHLYFNRSGNGWADRYELKVFPHVDSSANVAVVDLRGNGTACLTWTSSLPANARSPLRYVDLLGGNKPHLLVGVANNLGAETKVEYAPSTYFYLRDKVAGRPWSTRLPFPVQCVAKVTVTDKWRKTSFATTYSYHHGYFDGSEREFRGFGRVEQVDSESYGEFAAANAASPYITDDKVLYQPPVKSVTWFHTGAEVEGKGVLSQFAHEYFPQSTNGPGAFAEHVLPEPEMDADLSAEEHREALRACKGMVLRREMYELDVDALHAGREVATKLFSATSRACHVRCLQRRHEQARSVFLVSESEVITYHYELDISGLQAVADPRITHTLNLRFDELGNVLESIAAVYPRVMPFADASLPAGTVALLGSLQKERHVIHTETRFTNDPDLGDDDYRLRVPCETLTYDLTGSFGANARYLTPEQLRDVALPAAVVIPYHQVADGQTVQKRLVELQRILFLNDEIASLDEPAAFRTLTRKGLRYETYKLALTEPLLAAVFADRLTPGVRTMLDSPAIGGYLGGAALAARFPGEQTHGQYWQRSGIAGFAADASQRFYLPERYVDSFGNVTTLEFDPLGLFPVSSVDAKGNTTRVVKFDYRVLQPSRVRDLNDNFSALLFDVHGLPAAIAVEGKGNEADDLSGLADAVLNPSPTDLAEFFAAADLDEAQARTWLSNATARYVYSLGDSIAPSGVRTWNAHPSCSCKILRERHVRTLGPGEQGPLQLGFDYFDGRGGALAKKVQAEPAAPEGPLRWIVNGRSVLNNKGRTVKQYEPYFSAPEVGHRFEEPQEAGVTSVTYYDALGRRVRVEFPDGSYSRIEFSPWQVRRFDRNDTAKEPENAWFAARTALGAAAADARAAQLTEAHSGTPAITLLDSLGRSVVGVSHNRVPNAAGVLQDERFVTVTRLDAEGRTLWTRDPRGNLVVQAILPPKPTRAADEPDAQNVEVRPANSVACYDMCGSLLARGGMDGGARWMLPDGAGRPMLGWDSNEVRDAAGVATLEERMYTTRYDALNRPAEMWLSIGGGAPSLVARSEYVDAIDNVPNAAALNLRGQLRRHFDPSGLTQIDRLDFKGGMLAMRRQLTATYRERIVDWQNAPPTQLEAEVFTLAVEYDALRRATRLFNWHHGVGSRVAVHEAQYNERGQLAHLELVTGAVRSADGFNENPGSARSTVIEAIQFDARGQRVAIRYGNGTLTRYAYDPQTFRLRQLRTTRAAFDPPFPSAPGTLSNAAVLQNLHYTYDPVGNVVEIRDDAYEPAFFRNQVVEARNLYAYDALYRLTSATGRENGAAMGAPAQIPGVPDAVVFPRSGPNELRNYVEEYRYDTSGNLDRMRHGAGAAGWVSEHRLAPDSNRIASTNVDNPAQAIQYRHDLHGNLLNLANVSQQAFLRWDYRDMLQMFDRGGGGRVYYNYDAGKTRTRKVNENAGSVAWERIYLGELEIFRRYAAGVLVEEIESIHVIDGSARVLLVEDVLRNDNAALPLGPLHRYQYGNQIGSVALELNGQGDVISYEEYSPFGNTVYRATSAAIRAAAKRYRFCGKERDEESGLVYYGARHYAPWLARWTACDPSGLKDGVNLYCYVANSPLVYVDPTGRDKKKTVLQLERVETEDTSAEYYYDNKHGVGVRRSAAGTEVWEETDVNQYRGVVTVMTPEVYKHPTAKSITADLKDMMPQKFQKKYGVSSMEYTKLQELLPPPPPIELPPEDKTLYMGADGRLGTADQLAEAELAEGLANVGKGSTALGGSYALAATVLGADAKEAARMGNLGDQIAPIVSIAAFGAAGLGRSRPPRPPSVTKKPEFYAEGIEGPKPIADENRAHVIGTLTGQGNYQLIGQHPPDEPGQSVVRTGEGKIMDRFYAHARGPDRGVWLGMQVIGKSEGVSQRLTLEADLGLEHDYILSGEPSSLYKLPGNPPLGFFAPTQYEQPTFTLLNPAIYPSARAR